MKKTLAFFPVLLSNKPDEKKTNYMAPKGILTITVTVIGYSFKEVRGRWNHRFQKERRFFQWKNILTKVFLSFLLSQTSNWFYEGPENYLIFVVEFIIFFL